MRIFYPNQPETESRFMSAAQQAGGGEVPAVAGYPLRGLLSGFNMTTGNLSSLSGLGGDTRYLQITAPV